MDPPSQTVKIANAAKFTIKLSGVEKEKFSYQWRHNEENINEQISKSLTLSNVTEDDRGTYDCVVRNDYGDEFVSTSAELLVDCEFYNTEIVYYFCVIH